jgi:predicted nucleotidyltransferase
LPARIKEKAKRLVELNPEVKKVTPIGSLARGDYTALSDVDLLVILKESPLPMIDRVGKYLPFFDLPIGVDLLAYTEDELQRRRDEEDFTLARALREGKVLA